MPRVIRYPASPIQELIFPESSGHCQFDPIHANEKTEIPKNYQPSDGKALTEALKVKFGTIAPKSYAALVLSASNDIALNKVMESNVVWSDLVEKTELPITKSAYKRRSAKTEGVNIRSIWLRQYQKMLNKKLVHHTGRVEDDVLSRLKLTRWGWMHLPSGHGSINRNGIASPRTKRNLRTPKVLNTLYAENAISKYTPGYTSSRLKPTKNPQGSNLKLVQRLNINFQ